MQELPRLGIMGWVKVIAVLALAAVAIVAAVIFLGFVLVIGLVASAIFAGWAALSGRRPKIKRQTFVFTNQQPPSDKPRSGPPVIEASRENSNVPGVPPKYSPGSSFTGDWKT